MTGTLVITLDFELAWGSFDIFRGDPRHLEAARWTHEIGVPAIIAALEKAKLSATWAIVGALAGDGLPTTTGFTEVSYPHYTQPWFDAVPRGVGEKEAPEWFAPSLVHRLRAATTHQEIAFHSFSHVLFDHPGTPRDRVEMTEKIRFSSRVQSSMQRAYLPFIGSSEAQR